MTFAFEMFYEDQIRSFLCCKNYNVFNKYFLGYTNMSRTFADSLIAGFSEYLVSFQVVDTH